MVSHGSANTSETENPGGIFQKFFDVVCNIEKALVAFCLAGMVILVLIQIILRNFWNSGLVGGDSIVKHLVLWVAFLGASLATRDHSHIRIDVASKILPTRLKPAIQAVVDCFSIVVTAMLFYAAYKFVALEYEGHATLPFFDIPVWVMEIIIPIGFLTILMRFVYQAFLNFQKIVKG